MTDYASACGALSAGTASAVRALETLAAQLRGLAYEEGLPSTVAGTLRGLADAAVWEAGQVRRAERVADAAAPRLSLVTGGSR